MKTPSDLPWFDKCQRQSIFIWITVAIISVHLGASRVPPRILASNQDEFGAISIPIATTVSLTCEGDEPVKWKTHGRKDIAERTDEQTSNEITIDNKYQSIVVVSNTVYTDTGNFICYYNDSVDSLLPADKAEIYVFVNEPPDVAIRPSVPMMHRIGDRFSLKCYIEGCPRSNVTWYWSPCATPSSCSRNYHVLSGPEHNEETQTEFKSEVSEGCPVQAMLTGVLNAAGYYMCVAENGVGKNTSEISTFIKEYQYAFHTTASSMQPYEQDNLVLDCYASKFYYSKIEWFWLPKGRNEPLRITNDSNIVVLPSQTMYTLLVNVSINPVVMESSGQYICRASEPSTGKTEEKKQLIIVRKTSMPIIMETNLNNKEYTVFKQVPFEFICKASGLPEPEIKWYLNGSLIRPINDTAIQFLDNGSKLYIARTLPKDSGRYLCEASNRAGAALRIATLIVLDEEKPAKVNVTLVIMIAVIVVLVVVAIIVWGLYFGHRNSSKIRLLLSSSKRRR